MKTLLKFNEEEYKESAKAIRSARKIAEEAADKVCEEGFSNIFFTAVGGSLSPDFDNVITTEFLFKR